MNSAWHVGVVFIGGGIGSAFRYGFGRASLALVGPNYPAATLVVNVVGCFLMGALAGWLSYRDFGIDSSVKLFLTTGLLGGFTTFSAFALDAVTLWERGGAVSAGIYVLISVAGSIAGLLAGLALMRTTIG